MQLLQEEHQDGHTVGPDAGGTTCTGSPVADNLPENSWKRMAQEGIDTRKSGMFRSDCQLSGDCLSRRFC